MTQVVPRLVLRLAEESSPHVHQLRVAEAAWHWTLIQNVRPNRRRARDARRFERACDGRAVCDMVEASHQRRPCSLTWFFVCPGPGTSARGPRTNITGEQLTSAQAG